MVLGARLQAIQPELTSQTSMLRGSVKLKDRVDGLEKMPNRANRWGCRWSGPFCFAIFRGCGYGLRVPGADSVLILDVKFSANVVFSINDRKFNVSGVSTFDNILDTNCILGTNHILSINRIFSINHVIIFIDILDINGVCDIDSNESCNSLFLHIWRLLSSTGFNLSSSKPAVGDPLGNPAYPGLTTTSANASLPLANWVGLLASNAPSGALVYNFAVGGASVNNSLTEGYNANDPDFVTQAATFIDNIATIPRQSYAKWTAANSMHIMWWGRNDVYWAATETAGTARIDAVLVSYFNELTALWKAGARNFLVMGIAPVWMEPVWTTGPPFTAFTSNITTLAHYWNKQLQKKLVVWEKNRAAAKVNFLDTWPVYKSILDNLAEYDIPSATCFNLNTTAMGGLSNGTDCAFSDTVHPGELIQNHVAVAVGQLLVGIGFLSSFGLKAA